MLPPERVNFTVAENSSKNASIEGEILAVIFDDPNQTTSNTIVLFFGANKSAGDTFSLQFAQPIVKAVPGFAFDMSLGISYSTTSGKPAPLTSALIRKP